jgi:iron complex outermembrane receptor protein
LAALGVLAIAGPAAAQHADTVAMKHDPAKYQIVVTATKTPKDPTQVPSSVSVVRGDELRRRGVKTVAEALQDVVGIDTGEGSDNGQHLPNIGMWGLKEFDALLVMVDGFPVGGPFNPSLSQIPVKDIDRVEIVKGPQGSLYGVSAFAGVVSVFTRADETGRGGYLRLGGGSFDEWNAAGSWAAPFGDYSLRLTGSTLRMNGWQDRTGSAMDRGMATISRKVGDMSLALDLGTYNDMQDWGSPTPYDAGAPLQGFLPDKNYAVRGARVDHRVYLGNLRLSKPMGANRRLENTFGSTHDMQHLVRSFTEADPAAFSDTVASEGVAIKPRETTVFDDLRLVSNLDLAGPHELVTGAAITWGKTIGDGIGFDFDQQLSDPASIPDVGQIPVGDVRSFEDNRTFLGFYAHDTWTPIHWFTVSGGGRYDDTHEKLHVQAQEQGPPLGPLEEADDERSTNAWSGDISGLVRILPAPRGVLETANAYVTWASAFKPAAPNILEAEGAEILDPERTHSLEIGLKTLGFERQVAFDVNWFDMTFDNMVVSILGPGGGPELTNAGSQRFKGWETQLVLRPERVSGTSLTLGYAYHDARFVNFTFVTPDSQLRDVSGKRLELVPRDMFSARLDLVAPRGIGVFAAVRYQGDRPLTRRNTFFADPFTEWDAGASYQFNRWRLSVVGRNLGDDRHIVTESELGDSQHYIAPPRRVTLEATATF